LARRFRIGASGAQLITMVVQRVVRIYKDSKATIYNNK